MSLCIRFESTEAVRRFLRYAVQPQVAYRWHDDDRFFVGSVTKDVRRGPRTVKVKLSFVFVWLPHVEFADPILNQVLALVKHEKWEQPPDDAKQQCKEYGLETFLRLWPLVAAKPSKRARLDLLVAFYVDDKRLLADAFSEVQKNPHHPSTIVFLEQDAADGDAPRCLFLLPQADAGGPWPIWLETENRRMRGGEDGKAAVKLFYRLPGGAACEYYVEYGWTHPLPELRELYPNPKNAQYVLIAGADRDGKPRTQWVHLMPRVGDMTFELEPGQEQAFDVSLDGLVTPVQARTAPAGEQLGLRPRVLQVAAEFRSELESVEKRIQGAKNALFQLERQRQTLLDRRQSRFRLLLKFRQPPAPADRPDELAAHFQRFLLLSRRHLDQFQYVYEDLGTTGGWHYVCTRDPVFYQDLQVGLADEIYYQPYYWQDWQFDVFVRDDCELLPRMDSEELARDLGDKLRGAAEAKFPGTGTGHALLVAPDADRPTGLRLTAVALPFDADLRQQLKFLNAGYPVAEVASREQARVELLGALTKAGVDLEEEVAKTERLLVEQATKRFEVAQHEWNETQAAVDRTVRGVETVGDEHATFNEMLAQFEATWVKLVQKTLSLNAALVAPKLEAFKRLEAAEKTWHQLIDDAKRGHQDVHTTLAPIGQKIDDRLAEAEVTYQQAELVYKLLAAKEKAARVKLQAICDKIDAWLQEAETAAGRLERQNANLQQKQQRAAELLQHMADLINRINTAIHRFDALIGQIDQHQKTAAAQAQLVEDKERELDGKVADWKAVNDGVREQLALVKQKHAVAQKEIEGLDARVKRKTEQAAELEKDLADQQVRLQEDQDAAQDRLKAAEEALGRVKVENARLHALLGQVTAMQARVTAADRDQDVLVGELQRFGSELRQALDGVRRGQEARLGELAKRCDEAARDLQALAAIELECRPLEEYSRATRLRRQAEDAARRVRPLPADTHRRVWQS